jgi:hypothetical protein
LNAAAAAAAEEAEAEAGAGVKAGAGVGHHAPVAVVVLALLLDCAQLGAAKRCNAKDRIQPLEHVQPTPHRLVIELKVLAQGVD